MDHDMQSGLPPVQWYGLLGHWAFQPWWLLVCVLLAAAYVGGVLLAHRNGQASAPVWRQACFLVGVGLLYVTVGSGIAIYGEVVFWAHMVEHLALVMVVPALLALGNPVAVLGGGRTPGSPVSRVLTHPAFGFAFYAAVIVGTHLTGFMDAMMTAPWLTQLERVLYVAAGFLLLTHLIGDEPYVTRMSTGMRLFFSVVMMTPDTVVGIVLLQTGVNLFPSMDPMRPGWAGSALQDIHTGGALMWALGDGLMMLVSVGLILTLVASPQRDRVLGTWLDSARAGAFEERTGSTADPDADGDEALAAYNEMLGRMGSRSE